MRPQPRAVCLPLLHSLLRHRPLPQHQLERAGCIGTALLAVVLHAPHLVLASILASPKGREEKSQQEEEKL